MDFKRFLKFVGLVIALQYFSINASAAPFSGGDGSQNNPYLISSKEDLQELADSVHYGVGVWDCSGKQTPRSVNWSCGKYFELTRDITDTVRTPIGRTFFF